MKELIKKVGKGALVVLGTAAIVAGGIWAAKELSDDVSDSSTDVDTGADGQTTTSN